MEKRGVIDENTPPETPVVPCPVESKPSGAPTTKTAADALEDHATVRAADAVADAARK